ncbi:MAG: ribosome maturation factor RimP [Clostridia bacterium]|nr:ribosome maturation factor RimP [Clostridia bacterium]
MNSKEIRAAALELAERVAEPMGLIVVDATYGREGGHRVLRVVLDRPGGVTLDHLERFARVYGDALDEADFIPDSYSLETQSPGLNRTLRSDREFEVFRGRAVTVRTYAPIDGRQEFEGELGGLEDGAVVVTDGDGRVWRIPRDKVARARLRDD